MCEPAVHGAADGGSDLRRRAAGFASGPAKDGVLSLKLLVLFNPGAGAGKASRQSSALRRTILDRHPHSEFLSFEDPVEARRTLVRTNLANYDAVVAAGGDGTVFHVLNGLYGNPHPCALGVIPLGTGNAFAREFGLLPSNWKAAVARLDPANLKRIDVGQVDWAGGTFYFLNIVGIGFATDAGLTARRVKFVGRSAYTIGALWRMLRLRSYPLEMQLDGETVRQRNVLVEISNSRFTGTSFLMAPSAELDDGLLDVTWLGEVPRLRLVRLLKALFKGGHVRFPEVQTRKARVVNLAVPQGYLLMPDGEFEGHTPARITCLHRDLALFC